MTRRNDCQETWVIANKLAVNVGDDFLLARMGAGSNPERAWPNLMPQLLELRAIHWQGRGGSFDVADHDDFTNPESTEAFGLSLVLRKAYRKGAEHGANEARSPPPARVGGCGKPAIDQHHRDSAGARRQHEVGPQLRFDP